MFIKFSNGNLFLKKKNKILNFALVLIFNLFEMKIFIFES
jgi:hypothetical protein